MLEIIFNIKFNFSIEVILVVISLLFILKQNKKKGDRTFFNLKVGNISISPTIKFLNFNINSKNKNNFKNY